MIGNWLVGLLKTRSGRMIGTVGGIAITVALLADLGLFLEQSSQTMTARALQSVSTDWQVELVPGSANDTVLEAVRAAAPTKWIDTVAYAVVSSFGSTTGDTTQTTGAGKAVGVPAGYFDRHAGDYRLLAGDPSGATLLQQTASNLHVQPGDTITLQRPGLGAASIRITGVIDLRSADSFFQAIGAPAGAAPQAPPDNAVFLPEAQWAEVFAPQADIRPDSVRTQFHVTIDHTSLPTAPEDAYAFAAAAGRNLEERVAGAAVLSNNLAARLDATRGDALYARVLFLFLGSPGAILAALLTFAVAASGLQTRRRDQALLKLRGGTSATILQFTVAETILLGGLGCVAGLLLATVTAGSIAGVSVGARAVPWLVLAALVGMTLAVAAILTPALWSMRTQTFARAQLSTARLDVPLWQRLFLDLICLIIAALVFWRTAATGYQVVLATEGVTATAVDYTAFLAPIFLWIGGGLLTVRLSRLCLAHGKVAIEVAVRPFAGGVSSAVAAAMSRQRGRIGMGVALAALAVAFLISTSIFNATYEAQGRVDAQLTNGADVTVTGTASTPAGYLLTDLRQIPGVASAEPMQHRYAYVGTDLQDLYGVDPARIGNATNMANAFFQNGDAAATLAALARQPDAVLVSEETVNDFQLSPGDTINLRLQTADHQYHVIPFVFSGVVREFPTAPRDSFLVANADYVAKMTGLNAQELVLLRVGGDPASVKVAVDKLLAGKGLQVTSLFDTIQLISSSLTAVDLKGLSRLELSFAIVLAAGATALVLGLGLADRRRDFAILTVLGARRRTLAAFVWAEGAFVLVLGTALGAVMGFAVAEILIKVLEGVFDPPPEQMSVPWGYVGFALAAILVATATAIANGVRQGAADPLTRLREQ